MRRDKRRTTSLPPPVAIGDEVYAVYIPMEQDDDVAEIEPWRVFGVGADKDGRKYVLNEDSEIFYLDDEDEGLAFSTRERAEEYLKKVQKT